MAGLTLYTAIIPFLFITAGCRVMKRAKENSVPDGTYRTKLSDNTINKVTVQNVTETIMIHRLKKIGEAFARDTSRQGVLLFPTYLSKSTGKKDYLRKRSFDIDIVILAPKYRFSINDFPAQLNTTVNAAFYLGYRNDSYRLKYKAGALSKFNRQTRHFAFSIGSFIGIGAADINPWVTGNQVSSEYTGFVLENGIIGITGIQNISVGLALGVNHLVDKNKRFWMYEGKPYISLVLGFNLN